RAGPGVPRRLSHAHSGGPQLWSNGRLAAVGLHPTRTDHEPYRNCRPVSEVKPAPHCRSQSTKAPVGRWLTGAFFIFAVGTRTARATGRWMPRVDSNHD